MVHSDFEGYSRGPSQLEAVLELLLELLMAELLELELVAAATHEQRYTPGLSRPQLEYFFVG